MTIKSKRTLIILSTVILIIVVISMVFAQKPRTQFDVIVIGGEPEGVAAAVSSARNGAQTLLIEPRDGLGGVMTYAMLNYLDMGQDIYGKNANAGIFAEWHKLVGKGNSFDIHDAKAAFLRLVHGERRLTLELRTNVKQVIIEHGQMKGLVVENHGKTATYYAKRFIDATQDADIATLAGVPSFVGNEDIGLQHTKMSVTLMIHLKGVDWPKIVEVAKTKKFGDAQVANNVAWGFGTIRSEYKPFEPDTRLRGLNIARQKDGTVYINALQIFGVDGLSEESKHEAIERGKRETEHILNYLRDHFPGFEQASIASFPPELYIRETRHILAEYQLSIQDVWENRDQWDSIGFGSYPVDVQATSAENSGNVIVNPVQYAIPFRSLVPKKVDGLLVASRSAGYSSLAAGSARTLPVGMTTGQAAGTAAALSIQHQVDLRSFSKDKDLIHLLQKKLIDQGANLYPFHLKYPYQGAWFYPQLMQLVDYALVGAGYKNDVRPEEPMKEGVFKDLVRESVCRSNKLACGKLKPITGVEVTRLLTRDQAAKIINQMFTGSSEGKSWELAVKNGWIDSEMQTRIPDDRQITRSEAFYIVAKAKEFFVRKNEKEAM